MKAYGGVDVCTYLIFKIYNFFFFWQMVCASSHTPDKMRCYIFLKTQFILNDMYEHSVRTSQKTYYVFPAKTNQLVDAVLG
jgi:hypothetical protein